ncbi:unnamed protein product [Linum trigynum]|uniref:Uncharacterized protein n=1 Tax=Linum trigynum TaxID=586398 RepID=A0AAV2F5N0_9ROSI
MTIVKYPPSCDVDLIDAPLNGEINVTVKYPPSGDVDLIDAPLTSNQHDRYYGSHLSKLRRTRVFEFLGIYVTTTPMEILVESSATTTTTTPMEIPVESSATTTTSTNYGDPY